MNENEIQQMVEQVQQMQAQMVETQAALAEETVEGTAGGGVVKVVMTGGGEVRSVEIAPVVVDRDEIEMLQDLVVAAVNDAARRSRDLQAERMGGVTGGLGDALGGGVLGGGVLGGGLDGLLG